MTTTSAKVADAGRRVAPLALGFAGAALAAYPILRPYAAAGGDTAAQFASMLWPLSHLLGMAGFVAIALARSARTRSPLAWLAASFLLPYYGAEALGLHAVGEHVGQAAEVAATAEAFRYGGLSLALFAVGLVLLGAVGVQIFRQARDGAPLARWSSAAVGLGLVTYLPQFFLPAPGRMLHGVVLGAGLVALAIAEHRQGTGSPAPIGRAPAPLGHL